MNKETKRQQNVDVNFRKYLFESAVKGRQLRGKELDLAVRANNAIKQTKGQLPIGAGNQRSDISNTDGRSSHLKNMARTVRRQVENTPQAHSLSPNAHVRHAKLSAASAEMMRGGNCDEHANLTAVNLIAQKRNTTIEAQTFSTNPNLDHIYTRAVTTESQTNWVKNKDTKKWEDKGQRNVTHTMVADAWITNPHAVRKDDYALKDHKGHVVVRGAVTGDDILSDTKKTMGFTQKIEDNNRITATKIPHATGQKVLNDPGMQKYLFNENKATHQSFSADPDNRMQKHSNLMSQIRQHGQRASSLVGASDALVKRNAKK